MIGNSCSRAYMGCADRSPEISLTYEQISPGTSLARKGSMPRLTKLAAVALAAAVFVPGCDGEEGTVVGPRGGVVTSEDGRVTLDVPEGALADEVAIQIVEAEDTPEDAIGPAYVIEPFGLTFSRPAELTYDVSDSAGEMDADAVRLVIEREDSWSTLADCDVDMASHEVSASVVYSSTVGIIE